MGRGYRTKYKGYDITIEEKNDGWHWAIQDPYLPGPHPGGHAEPNDEEAKKAAALYVGTLTRELDFSSQTTLGDVLNRIEWQKYDPETNWSGKMAIAQLGVAIDQREVEALWGTEHSMTRAGLPSVKFEVEDKVVRILIAPQHNLVTADSIKRPFQIAMHRKYPSLRIEWLDGPLPAI